MRSYVLTALLAALACGGLGFASTLPPATEPVELSEAGHTLVIEYVDASGPWRRARVTVKSEAGADAPWGGTLKGVHLDGLQPLSAQDQAKFRDAGYPQTATVSGAGTAELVAPAPANLKRMWFLGSSGEAVSYRIPTDSHNPSTQGDDDKDKDEDPDPGEGGGDGDDGGDNGDDDGDDKECTGAGFCVGIFNPWTCTCHSDIRDPWGGEPSGGGQQVQISF